MNNHIIIYDNHNGLLTIRTITLHVILQIKQLRYAQKVAT